MLLFKLDDREAEMLARKAPHGKPCTSCGLCCHVQLCDMACVVLEKPKGSLGPCPALIWKGKESSCGMLTEPTKYSARAYAVGHRAAQEAAALMIDPGTGCDMGTFEDHNAPYRAKRDAMDTEPARAAKLKWAWRVLGFANWARKQGLIAPWQKS